MEIANALGVSPMYFYEGINSVSDSEDSLPVDLKSARVARMFDAIPEGTMKDEIYDLIRVVSLPPVSSH